MSKLRLALWACTLVAFAPHARAAVDVSTFGCVGDDSTDNTACLANLRAYLLLHDNETVTFQPGTYRYSDNTWLRGVKNVTINATNVGFRNMSTSGWDCDKTTLLLNPDYFTDNAKPDLGTDPGYRINTVSAGSNTATLMNPSDSGYFAPGSYVLVAGYNQQNSGWPPNFRYYEINKIASVNNGLVTLLNPVKYTYDSRWAPQTIVNTITGPAILEPLNRGGSHDFTLAEHIVINGATLKSSPAGGSQGANDYTADLGSMWAYGVKNFECNNCRLNLLFTGEGDSQTYKNSYVQVVEADKVLDTLTFDGCTLKTGTSPNNSGFTQATGITNLFVTNSTLQMDFIVAPRYLTMQGNQIYSNSSDHVAALIGTSNGPIDWAPITKAVFSGNTWHEPSGATYALVSGPATRSFTVAAAAQNYITTAFSYEVQETCGVGMTIRGPAGKTGSVSNIWYNGSQLVIEGTFSAVPLTGESWTCATVKALEFDGETVLNSSSQAVTAPMVALNQSYLDSLYVGPAQSTAPVITTTSLATGTVGSSYSQVLTATGTTPITWTVASGSLPLGLTLSSTGTISGTPSVAGTFTFTVQAANTTATSKQFSLTVNAAPPIPPVITTSYLPDGVVGTPYSQVLAATGTAPISWTVSSGSLPPGLSLSQTGAISGTPTTAVTSTVGVTATNGAGSSSTPFSLTINAAAGSSAASDTIPPVVRVLSPTGGSTISASAPYTLTVNATDNVNVVSVQYRLDGVAFATATAAPFSWTWDTSTVKNRGWHTLDAVAKDAAGNTGTSGPVQIRVR